MPKSVKLDDQFGFRLCDLHSVNDVDLSGAEASVAASDRMMCCQTASDVACQERGTLPLDVQRAGTVMFLCNDFNSKIIEDANLITIKAGSGNSRRFQGLSSGPETIFACAAFHSANCWSTSPCSRDRARKGPGLRRRSFHGKSDW